MPRFTDNKDCQSAFKAYMCYINFPRSVDVLVIYHDFGTGSGWPFGNEHA